MDLIEQLGGYDSAKAKCDRAKKEGYLLLSVPVENGFGDIYVYKVEAALLEYRRANNIFEVGDAMIIPSRGNGIFYFNALFSDSDIAEARHATDAEIKAGKRSEIT